MAKLLQIFIGPELFWILMILLTRIGIKVSGAPSESMDSTLLAFTYIVPLVLIPLSFGLYYVPGCIRSWLLIRILVAGLIGSHCVLNDALLAHSRQGPGVGTAYIVGMLFGIMILIAGTVWALIKFRK